jgi:hypothetical protein
MKFNFVIFNVVLFPFIVGKAETASLAGTTLTSLDGMEEARQKAAPVEVSPDDIAVGMFMDPESAKTVRAKGGFNIDKHPTIGKKSGPGMFWSSIIYIENWVRPKKPKKKKPIADDVTVVPPATEKTTTIDDFIELSVSPNGDVSVVKEGPDLYPLSNTSFAEPYDTSSTLDASHKSLTEPEDNPDGNTSGDMDAEQDSHSLLKVDQEVDLFQDFAFDI